MEDRVEMRARADYYFVYSGRSLLVTNIDGQVTGMAGEGFYYENTRLLSRDELAADGQPLKPVVASPVGGPQLLAYLEVPRKAASEHMTGPKIPERALYLESGRKVDGGMRTELRITNYHAHEVARFDFTVRLAADFADIMETQIGRGKRKQEAPVETHWDADKREIQFRYCHPDLDRAVAIRIERTPGHIRFDDGALVVPLELHPHQSAELHLTVEPLFDGQRVSAPPHVFGGPPTELDQVRERLRAEIPRLTTTNTTVALAWRTATQDLATLPLGIAQGPATPIAGLPLYQQVFGCDALTIAWQALLAMPSMMRDTLMANAAYQGTTIDDWRDEEPGKMLHQARQGPMSALGMNPYTRYYGDYATPPDFLIGLGQYLAWTNDLHTVRELLPAARKALTWLERYADLNGDGFIEYAARSQKGVKNQGWKDSKQAIVDEHGKVVKDPIATCELQAYWYAGLRQVALAFFLAGDRAYAIELLGKARALQRRFDKAFWMEQDGFYALGLGPNQEQIRTLSSNPGHLLATGIVPCEKALRVIRRLMEPDFFTGWGVRTISSKHVAYNPFSYHVGSVWPVDSGTFALGFARYGCWDEMHRLLEGLFAASELFVGHRLPEVLSGLPRDAQHPHPGIYPQSDEPQGWSLSPVVMAIQALLGMQPMAPLGLLLIDPHLPEWLPDLRLENLRVGRSRLDLQLWRTKDGETDYRVTRREGSVRVLRQPPPQGPESSPVGRARAAVGSMFSM